MQYNVAQLLKEPTGAVRQIKLDWKAPATDGFAGALDGDVRFLRTHQGLLVKGKVEAQVNLTCARCLSDFAAAAHFALEEEFFPVVDVNTGQRMPLPDDAEGTIIDTNHILDLTEVLRQYVIGAPPIKPLCRDDCAGLCSECGVDLNREGCVCAADSRDPRWGALTALLGQAEG